MKHERHFAKTTMTEQETAEQAFSDNRGRRGLIESGHADEGDDFIFRIIVDPGAAIMRAPA